MAQRSAGLLMYCRTPELKVFLIHPGGPYNAGKQTGVWSLPKGTIERGEEDLAAALREFYEETGIEVNGPYAPLGEVAYRSGKRVAAWAVEHDQADARLIHSIAFTMEWPPRSGRQQEFPEADDGRYFDLAEAREAILPAQVPFLDRLQELLAGR